MYISNSEFTHKLQSYVLGHEINILNTTCSNLNSWSYCQNLPCPQPSLFHLIEAPTFPLRRCKKLGVLWFFLSQSTSDTITNLAGCTFKICSESECFSPPSLRPPGLRHHFSPGYCSSLLAVFPLPPSLVPFTSYFQHGSQSEPFKTLIFSAQKPRLSLCWHRIKVNGLLNLTGLTTPSRLPLWPHLQLPSLFTIPFHYTGPSLFLEHVRDTLPP